MTAKVQIVEELGETQVLLPELLAAALAANYRAKVRMTLLQEAVAHAQNPAAPPHTLEAERRGAGLDQPVFASTVKDARALDAGGVAIPGAGMLLAGLYGDIEAMMAPISLADAKRAESARAAEIATRGAGPVIMVRPETSTADVAGFAVSGGILTARGGRTAHAAVVARQLGKACVVGCAALSVDESARQAEISGRAIKEGDWISIDGDSGEVFLGKRRIVTSRPRPCKNAVSLWLDSHGVGKSTCGRASRDAIQNRANAVQKPIWAI